MKRGKSIRWPRKIIHIDMDAFFAAVEQRDHPEYRGKPVVVGGSPKSRGVVSTASYEARVFGIHSAMPSAQAHRLCPQAVFLHPRMEAYKIVSDQVMAILRQHTELVEVVSVDEAYLDVTRHRLGIGDPALVASLIKQNIFAATRLTASAGVATNMFLSKIASDFKKPDGLTVILPGEEAKFLEGLPVRKIPGVGPVTEKALHRLGLKTCADLAAADPALLDKHFGSSGPALRLRARGVDDREVEPWGEPKQSSCEETFEKDTRDIEFLKTKLREFADIVFQDLRRSGLMGFTVVLKLKYYDFELITRSKTLNHLPESPEEISNIAASLLETKTLAGEKPVRLIGLGVGGLRPVQEIKRLKTPDLFTFQDFR